MTRTTSKIWRPTPQYNRSRRLSRCILVELNSAEQREELKARAAAEGMSMNRYVVTQLFGDEK